MRDFHLLEAGFEPRRGPGAVVLVLRRGLRMLLRPLLSRLTEVCSSLADQLDVTAGRCCSASLGKATHYKLDLFMFFPIKRGSKIDPVWLPFHSGDQVGKKFCGR